jgi:hypothetical protein
VIERRVQGILGKKECGSRWQKKKGKLKAESWKLNHQSMQSFLDLFGEPADASQRISHIDGTERHASRRTNRRSQPALDVNANTSHMALPKSS